MGQQELLEFGGATWNPLYLITFLETIHDLVPPLVIDGDNVARMQPSVGIDRGQRSLPRR
jgi:hypothetical protein